MLLAGMQRIGRSFSATPAYAVALVAVAVVAPGVASANDLFLKPESFKLEPGVSSSADVLNGSIEKSRNAVSWDRLSRAQVVAGDAQIAAGEESWSTDGDLARMAFKTGPEGTQVLGISTEPRVITFTPEQFDVYLRRNGLDAGDSAGRPDIVRERYAKHARALVQVGEARTDHHQRSLGQPVEIVFDQNPYDLKFGKEISFTVLSSGQPTPDLAARAGCEGFHGHDASGNHVSHYDLRTDDEGRAGFLLSQKCVWYVSVIALAPSESDDADYESHWATATFEVF